MERDSANLIPKTAERVNVAIAKLSPIDELNAQLETSLHGGQHLGFVDLEHLVEFEKGRDGCLTYTDRSDRFGFDDGNINLSPRFQARQGSCSHPASSPASDNYDPLNRHEPDPLAFYIPILNNSANCERSFCNL